MSAPDHSKRGHSEFGGSGASRWLICPASIIDARGLPPLPSSEAAEEGTLDHELAELILRGGVVPEATDPDRMNRVQSYVDFVRAKRSESYWSAADEYIEENLELNALAWGSADYALVNDFGTAYLCDYKGGIKPVGVDENPQLAFYAVCLAERFDLDTVHCQVFQPKLGGASAIWTMHLPDLRQWKQRFIAAIERVQAGEYSATAGAHCKYCRVSGTCRALQEEAVKEAQMDFAAPVPVPRSPATMTPAELAKVLALADTIDAWLKGVRRAAMEHASRGDEVPGFKLVEGKMGNRKWVDEAKVVRACIDAGVDPYERSVLTPAKVEKELGKPKFRDLLGALVHASPGAPALVPLSDKRKPLPLNSLLDFTAVSEE